MTSHDQEHATTAFPRVVGRSADGGAMGRRRRADEDEDEDVDEDVTTEEDEEDVSDVSDDARADEEEDDEADEDDELEAEMAALEAIKRERGRAKSGAVGAKTFVNNAKGLDACLEGA